jgi:hypothetical protein
VLFEPLNVGETFYLRRLEQAAALCSKLNHPGICMMGDFYHMGKEEKDDEAAFVSEVSETTTEHGGSLKLKTNDKLKALELLGRHLGMFKEKVEVTGKDGGPIQTQNADPDLSSLSDEEFEALERLVAKAGGNAAGAS